MTTQHNAQLGECAMFGDRRGSTLTHHKEGGVALTGIIQARDVTMSIPYEGPALDFLAPVCYMSRQLSSPQPTKKRAEVAMSVTLLSKSWFRGVLSGIAALGLVLVIVNVFLFLGNRTIQGDLNDRQQFINQSIQLDRLNRELIAALANLAARNNDDQVRSLLASHGITFTMNQPTGAGPAAGGGAAAAGRTKTSR
jgi:hypothetical protein